MKHNALAGGCIPAFRVDLRQIARLILTTAAGVCLMLPHFGCAGPKQVSDRDIESVSLTELQRLMRDRDEDKLLLIDVRPDESFQAGRLPGALHRQLHEVNPQHGRDPDLERRDHIVIYGQHPGSAPAKAVTKRLISMRYDGVRMFMGGFDAWSRAGLPVESGPEELGPAAPGGGSGDGLGDG